MTIGICDCQLREGERLRLMLEDYLKQEKLSGMVLIYSSGHDLLYGHGKLSLTPCFWRLRFPNRTDFLRHGRSAVSFRNALSSFIHAAAIMPWRHSI